jgi:hypothetical protein
MIGNFGLAVSENAVFEEVWHKSAGFGVYLQHVRPRSKTATHLLILLAVLVLSAKAEDKKTVGSIPVLLSRRCSRRELMNRGDGTWYFIKYRLDHRSYVNGDLQSSEVELRRKIAELMAPRLERVVFLIPDPNLSYGEVHSLLAGFREDDPSLHVVLVTKEQTGDFNEFRWDRFEEICLFAPHG